MKATARVLVVFDRPIRVEEALTTVGVEAPRGGALQRIEVEPHATSEDWLRSVTVLAYYDGELRPLPTSDAPDAPMIIPKCYPDAEACAFLRAFLSAIGAETLQGGIWAQAFDSKTIVKSIHWTLEDGSEFEGMRSDVEFAQLEIPSTARRGVTPAIWQRCSASTNGGPLPPPWRYQLAQAMDRGPSDSRNATLHAATAMDIGCEPFLPDGTRFNMTVLTGTLPGWSDLRATNPELYRDASELWYTRHGLIHRGEFCISTTWAGPGDPNRRLDHRDVGRFIDCVPRVVEFVEAQAGG